MPREVPYLLDYRLDWIVVLSTPVEAEPLGSKQFMGLQILVKVFPNIYR